MKSRPVPVRLATAHRGRDHRALAVFPHRPDQPRPGRGPDRESAIARALHRTCIFYADPSVEGGASLLRTIQAGYDNLTGAGLASQIVESQLPPEQRAAYHAEQHPFNTLAKSADDYAAPAPNEATPGIAGRVVQGAAKLLPQVAAVIGTGGEGAISEAATAAARAVPYVGRVLGGIAEGLPTAAKFTGINAANLPDTMTPGEKVAETAKDFATNATMAGLPVAAGRALPTRIATGAAIGAGTSAGLSALSGQPQDAAQNIIGAIQGGAFGAIPHAVGSGDNARVREPTRFARTSSSAEQVTRTNPSAALPATSEPPLTTALPETRFPNAEPGSLSDAANAVHNASGRSDLRQPEAAQATPATVPTVLDPTAEAAPPFPEQALAPMPLREDATRTAGQQLAPGDAVGGNVFDAFSSAPAMERPAFRTEPLGAKGLLVYGDADAIRTQLAAAGFRKQGRARDDALRFDLADRPSIEDALAKPTDSTPNPFDAFSQREDVAPTRASDADATALPENTSTNLGAEPFVDSGEGHLVETQAEPQHSPAFRNFIDGSKVVDAGGAPKIVYHGTGEGFNVFDNARLGRNTGHMTAPLGHFLTESLPEARKYAEKAADGVPADERVISAYVSIKNPKDMSLSRFLDIDSHDEARALRAKLEREGYDGIRLAANGKTQWVAFHSGQIKDVDNRGTFDRQNPDIRFQRTPGESGTGLAKEEVKKLAAGVLGMNPDDAGIHVIDSAEQLPQAVKDHMQTAGIPSEEVHAVHHRGNTYLLADKLGSAESLQEAIFHEHYTHGGLRARYGNKLGGKLTELVRGVGGMDGIRRLAKDQGVDLSHYEATTLNNPKIPEKQQHLILMEELLAHMSKLTGTLKRTVQEWVGALRDFLRRNGFAKLAEYGETDLAHVLKQARLAAIEKTGAANKSRPFYMRAPADREQRATPQSILPPRRPGEAREAYVRRFSDTAAEVKAATSLRTQQKTIGRHAIREMLARRSRAMDTADAVFNEYRTLFDKTDPARNLANVDDWEAGRKVRDSTFRSFLSKMQDGFDERIARLHQLDPSALRNLITNYMPHLYKDPARAAGVFSSFVDRHSIAGDKSFLKPREWPTLRQAMESGLQPITTNPVDWVLAKYASMDKYAGMLELRKELADRGWLPKVGANEQPPFGFKRVADPAFNGVAVPETLARDITNYLDPGFSKYAAWRTLRGAQNFMVAADLGFSGFHAVFTSTDNVIMHMDVAARRAVIGDSRGAAAALVKGLTSVATAPFEGHKLSQQWRGIREADENTAAILDALERGGARWKMSTTEYQNAIPKVARWWRQMMGAGIRANTQGKTPAELAVGAIKVPGTALQAVAEIGSYVIHHWLVPNQKMAARVLLYKYELDRRANDLGKNRGDYAGIIDAMHPDVVRQLAAQVNDVVDFRLGQMTYDNRFWNRTVQDLAQAAVMAPGWQYGMLQTVLGAGKAVKDIASPIKLVAPLDKSGQITNAHMGRVGSNLSYFLTLALTLGGGMAALQYLLTGKGPDEIKDYFFPRTGRKNDDDSDERLQLPNYWVDHYKLTTEPTRTAENKIHPLWKMLWELGHNKDYFGTQIRNPDTPALEQIKQIGEYIASRFVPITVGNIRKGMARDESTAQHVGHFFGINTAPLGVARSTFQNFVMQGGTKGWGDYTKTQDESARRQDVRTAAAAIRRGDQPILDSLAPDERAKARKDAQQPVPALLFKKLSDIDKLRAWDLATPEERERYGLRATIGRMHLERSAPFKRLPSEQQAKYRQQLQSIRSGVLPQSNPFDRFDGR